MSGPSHAPSHHPGQEEWRKLQADPSYITVQARRRGRVSCSGRARAVLDYIDEEALKAERPLRQITLPLSPWHYAELQFPQAMNEREWAQMMRVLEACKPGMVDRP